ncbi:hypothetical protein G5C66_18415 [Nocardioides sp. KC13]|uniref:Peptidase inhibitor family I36 protein n=1 Tax=Nocardioides turkmenicus TaxID=2711220 RepID=A0A6M1QXG9_9ACTN|nr:hypothetical protein [Nocardioides sp. KC13]NGN94705.1 hypothetical protein [Nocardioides sp. KC13]
MLKRILAVAALTLAVTSISSGAVAATGGGTDPSAKSGGDAREGVVAAAVSPSVSPAAEVTTWRDGGVQNYDCPSGRLCVDVWDPTRGTYKVFQFYRCQTHSLSAFYSTGYPEYENNQTSGTNTYFERSWGDRYLRSTAKHGPRTINWDPINFIDVC